MSENEHHIRPARNFAVPSRWQNTGYDGEYIWAELELKEGFRYQTKIQISPLRLSCSCKQRIYPCQHVIALAIMYLNDDLRAAKRPKWFKEFSDIPNNKNQSDNDKRRLNLIKQGLAQTERWIADIIGHGLEPIRHKKPDYYREHAKALVDIGAYDLAKEVESWAIINKPDWAEELLKRIAKLHLIIKAFNNYENLNPNLQSDLREAVNWQYAGNMTKVKDNWRVLAWYKKIDNKHNSQNIYLYGQNTQKYAFIQTKLYKKEHLDTRFFSDLCVELELSFYPSATPLRAEIHYFGKQRKSVKPSFGFDSIKSALANYANRKSKNPFMVQQPIMLVNIDLVKIKEDWYVVDNEGYLLKLPKNFKYIWQLKAIAKDDKLWLFGIWQAKEFKPLSVYSNGRIVDLKVLQGGR